MGRGPRLTDADFKLLTLVVNQRLLTSEQMYNYYSCLKNTKLSSFRVKLNRWSKYGFITPMKYSLGQDGFYFNYYRIGVRGIQTLVESGILDENWGNRSGYDFERKNVDHFLATQEIAIRAIVDTQKAGISVESIPPFESPYFDAEYPDNKLVIPDWIIRYDNTYLNIELDTGTESPQKIKEKVEGYIRLCSQQPSQKHIVLITVIDDSFRSRFSYSNDRSRRIGNIKKALFHLPGLHSPNLTVYVLPLSRVPIHIVRLISGQIPRNTQIRNIELDAGIEVLSEYNRYFEYKIDSEKSLSSVYPGHIHSDFYADKVVYFRNMSGTITKPYHLFLLEEGNVQQLDRLNSLYEMVSSSTNVSRDIIGVYTSTDERENDVIGKMYHRTMFADVEQWLTQMDAEPMFHVLPSPYRMEAVTFEGKVYS